MKPPKLKGPRAKSTLAPPRKYAWPQIGVVIAFVILAGRLWQLQVMSGDMYFRKSADNFVKELELPATRGQIRDRKGHVLADNRPRFNVYVTPRFFNHDSLDKLVELLQLNQEQIDALKLKVQQRKGLERLRQMLAFEDVTRDQLAVLETEKEYLPGVTVASIAHRAYPNGTVAAHALGYMNQIGPEELEKRREEGYQLGDYVGRAGLEKQWESFLRGKDGVERVIVDAKGQRKQDHETESLVGGLPKTDPVPGHDIVTTLDLDLQMVAERELSKHPSGAAAAVEVDTGRVLALASWPQPDPNKLTGRLSRADAERYNTDPLRPMMDKTLRENYFPGSTFKIVPMLASLEDHMADPDDTIRCGGSYRFGKRAFHCVEAHLTVDMHKSIVESCNVYYYQLGEKLGLDRMARVAHDFGFGQPTGLGLNGEVPGLIPTMEWYETQPGGFQKGFVLNTAIGQGSVKVTVLQLALAYAAIANGGKLYLPQIVERVQSAAGKVVQEFPPRVRHQVASTPEMLLRLRKALHDVVADKHGTAYAVRVPGLDIAGKTGTAQVKKNRRGQGEEGDINNDHAWFASFAPTENAKIAVVVLIEHGGFGAKAAAPVAVEIFKAYFGKQQSTVLTSGAP